MIVIIRIPPNFKAIGLLITMLIARTHNAHQAFSFMPFFYGLAFIVCQTFGLITLKNFRFITEKWENLSILPVYCADYVPRIHNFRSKADQKLIPRVPVIRVHFLFQKLKLIN